MLSMTKKNQNKNKLPPSNGPKNKNKDKLPPSNGPSPSQKTKQPELSLSAIKSAINSAVIPELLAALKLLQVSRNSLGNQNQNKLPPSNGPKKKNKKDLPPSPSNGPKNKNDLPPSPSNGPKNKNKPPPSNGPKNKNKVSPSNGPKNKNDLPPSPSNGSKNKNKIPPSNGSKNKNDLLPSPSNGPKNKNKLPPFNGSSPAPPPPPQRQKSPSHETKQPNLSLSEISSAVITVHKDFLSTGKSVQSWEVSQAALKLLQVDSWNSLGYPMNKVRPLADIMLKEFKVNAFIHCFVEVRRITTLYELEVEICRSLAFMDSFEQTKIKVDAFLDFVAMKEKVPAKENLCIRIQNLRMHIRFIRDARKSEDSSNTNLILKGSSDEHSKEVKYKLSRSQKKKKLVLNRLLNTNHKHFKFSPVQKRPCAQDTGKVGESVAFKYFVENVGGTNVKWVNEMAETGLPYDIVIGENEESKEYVKVKATTSATKDWFEISMREWQFALEKGESFYIARVVLMGPDNPKVTLFKNPHRLCQQGKLQLAVLFAKSRKKFCFW